MSENEGVKEFVLYIKEMADKNNISLEEAMKKTLDDFNKKIESHWDYCHHNEINFLTGKAFPKSKV